nr:DUF1801 domain-containing protein [Planctomycetota bacterium]
LALYVIIKDDDRKPLLAKLGKHKTGVSCLYINKLADVDLKVLEAMVARSWNAARDKYGNPE